MNRLAIWAGCSLLAMAVGAWAETSDAGNIETVVVTAAGTAQKIENASASISVITSEDLASKPYMSLTDALGEQVGVSIGAAKNSFTPMLRGLSSSYTLSMIDGQRVNSSANLFRYDDFDYSWLPIEAIERVEVVRSSMSSLYGSDAIGGVVNVITKPVSDRWVGSVTGAYVAQEDSNDGNSYKLDGFVSGPLIPGKLGVKAWGGYDRRLEDRDNSSSTSAYAGSTVGVIEDQHNAFAHGALVYTPDNDTKIEGSLGYSKASHKSFMMDRGDYAMRVDHDFGFMQSMVRVYGDRIHNYTGSGSSTPQPNTSSDLAIETRENIALPQWYQSLTVGADFRSQTLHDPYLLAGLPGVNSGSNPYASVHQWSVYGEDLIDITPKLQLTVGERFDDHENFGGHHSPRAYLVWHALSEVTLRGGWSRAFRAPTLLQMSPNWATGSCGGTGCYIIGNENLKPETSTSLEAGVQFSFGDIRLGVTAFHINLHNMIDTSHTSTLSKASSYSNFVEYLDSDGNVCNYSDGNCVASVFQYQNIANARTKGVETTFGVPLTDTLNMSGNYTFTDARDVTGGTALANVANHTANLRLEWQAMQDTGFFATTRFLGKQSLGNGVYRESYMTFDVGGRYDVTDHSMLRFGILNLTDRTPPTETSAEYKVDGRRYFLSLTLRN